MRRTDPARGDGRWSRSSRQAHALHGLLIASREQRAPATAAEACLYDFDAVSPRATAAALREAQKAGWCVLAGTFWCPLNLTSTSEAAAERGSSSGEPLELSGLLPYNPCMTTTTATATSLLDRAFQHMDSHGMFPVGWTCRECGKELNKGGMYPAELYAGTFTGLCYSCTGATAFISSTEEDGCQVWSYPPHCPSWRRNRETYYGYPDCETCNGTGVQHDRGWHGRHYCAPCHARRFPPPPPVPPLPKSHARDTLGTRSVLPLHRSRTAHHGTWNPRARAVDVHRQGHQEGPRSRSLAAGFGMTGPGRVNHAANEAWARVGIALAAKDSHAALLRLRYSPRVSWLVQHFAAVALDPRPTNDRCNIPRRAYP